MSTSVAFKLLAKLLTWRVPFVWVHELVLERISVTEGEESARKQLPTRRVTAFREGLLVQYLQQR